MSESVEVVFEERVPRSRGASVERQLGIPTSETLLRSNERPAGTHVFRPPHYKPKVTFVSSRANGETSKTKRGLLSSAGHGTLRWLAGSSGALLCAAGLFTEITIIGGLIATGGTLAAPLAGLAAAGVGAIVVGLALLDFATGRKKKL